MVKIILSPGIPFLAPKIIKTMIIDITEIEVISIIRLPNLLLFEAY